MEKSTERAPGATWGRRGLAAAVVLLLALTGAASAMADGFTIPPDLAGHAVLSCQDLEISGSSVITSEGIRTGDEEGNQGHVRSNGDVTLDGGVEVYGDAVAGPGGRVVFHGRPSTVTGAERSAEDPFDCAPIDLEALRQELRASNDNASIPPTDKGKSPLGGRGGNALTLNGRDSLTLPAGSYLFSDLRLNGSSTLRIDGPVRILVTGEVRIEGGSQVNVEGQAHGLRLWSAGASFDVGSKAEVRGFVYAPAAQVRLAGQSRLFGGVQGDAVAVVGGSRVVRIVDDAPPELEVTAPRDGDVVEDCVIPVTGRALDGQGPVALTVQGEELSVDPDGAFSGAASLWTDDPGLVVFEATDRAGNSTRVDVRVDIVGPVVELLEPAPGSLVGQRVVDLSGGSGTATEVTVDGVAAEVPGDGTFRLSGFDLGQDGLVELALVARNCGGSATATAVLDLDTLPPEISISSPASGALFGASPITVEGPVWDAHLTGVTVDGVPATVGGDRFRAEAPLAEGDNVVTATATDALGRTTTTPPLPVELDTLPPTVTLDTPDRGACLSTGGPVTIAGGLVEANPATGSGSEPPAVRLELRDSSGDVSSHAARLGENQTRWSVGSLALGSEDGTARATAVATDTLGRTARTAASWRLDATAPTVTLTLDGAPFPGMGPGEAPPAGAEPILLDRIVAAGVQVDDGSASAPPPAEVTLDGAPYRPGTSISAESDHLLVATATDCAGNSTTVHALFRIDRTGPTLVSSDPADGARLTTEPAAFSGTASEALSAARIDGREAVVDGSSFRLAPFPWREGTNRMRVELVDRAGNRGVQEVAFEVRSTPLTVEILESGAPLGDGAVFLRPVRPEVRASDSRATVTATLDGAPFASGSEVSSSGTYRLVADARDDLDRTAHAEVTFTVDLGAGPEVTITAPAEGDTVPDPGVDVSGTVTGDGVSVAVNGIDATVSEGTWTAVGVPLEPDAPNVLEAVARDRAGRTASDAVIVQSMAEGPQILILEPPDGVLTRRNRIDVAGVVLDPEQGSADGRVTVSNPGTGDEVTAPLDPGGSFRALDVPLGPGANTLRATTRDHQDRTGSDEVAVVADFKPPTVTFSADGAALVEGAAFGQPVDLAVEVVDDAGTPPAPVVRLNGIVRPEAASPRTEIPVTEEGGYVVAVVARDEAGNETRAERSFIVDFGGCSLTDIHPAAGAGATGASVTLVGRSGAGAEVAVRVPSGNGGYQEYPASVADGTFLAGDVPLPTVGTNALVLVCTDAAGREQTQEHPIERLPDGDGPTIDITAPADGALSGADAVTVEGTVSAGSVIVNGAPAAVTAGTGVDTFRADGVPLVEGPNVLGARALDAAGRTTSDRVVVERDSQPPKVQVTRPDNKSRVGRPGSGDPVVEVAGLIDLDTEPNLERVVVSSGVGEVVASVDPATGAFLATGVPLDAAAGAEVLQTLTVTATDSLGHTGTGTTGVYLDPEGPAIVLDAPEDLAFFGADAPERITVTGDAWAAEGARVSINGAALDPAVLAWEPAGGDGRRHVRFTTEVAIPDGEGAFGVIARVTDLDDRWAQDQRLLFHDTVPPEVVELVPPDGTEGVAPTSLLLVLFSEPVLHSSLAATDGLTLAHAADGQTVVGTRSVAGQAVAFTPGADLAPGDPYIFRAGTEITDRAGNALVAPAESGFTVAVATTTDAPVLEPLPSVLCADEISVRGTAAPGSTIEVRDGDLAFRGFADGAGAFAVSIPSAGSGYHLLRVRALDPVSGAASPEATAMVRIDCSAPRVVDARFDRTAGGIQILFSEALDPATVSVGGEKSAIRLTDAEVPGAFQSATVSFSNERSVELTLDDAADAWWRDRPAGLQVGPPAADLEGNAMTAVFETVFFPGADGGLAGGFLFGEAYDDTTGRPQAGAEALLYAAGVPLPGAVAPSDVGAPAARAATDGRGRYTFAGEVPSGRYTLVLSKDGFAPVYRRLAISPTRGLVPFDGRFTPRAETAGSLDPVEGGTLSTDAVSLSADAGALAGTDPVAVRLTTFSRQGIPDFLPLGWTPAATVEVRAVTAGVALAPGAAGWLPDGVHLEMALPSWVAPEDTLVAVRHEPAGGRWLALPEPVRTGGGTVRVELDGPGTVSVVVPDTDPATAPLVVPVVAGEVLAGVEPPADVPALEAELTLDPPVVPPTGRSQARVVARSADATTPWPSGLAVQAYLEEKLILAGGAGQILEAPFSVDLVLYHPRLSDAERAGATAGAAGAMEFVVSPSPRAGQVLLDVGYENIRLFPFPEEVEREPLVGPTGGTVETPEGVELTVPEGALAVKVPVAATLLDSDALAALREVAGYDTLAAVRVDLSGETLGRPASLSLPAPPHPSLADGEDANDPRLILAERVDVPTDGRGAYPKLVARARLDGAGDGARIVASPDLAGSLPLDGLVREGLYLVLRARAPMGYATGFVQTPNGAVLEASRVTADGLGTADITPVGGRFSLPVPAGEGSVLRALHPRSDETGTASIPSLAPAQVVNLDLTVRSVPPEVVSVAPADGASDQPPGTAVSVLFSEPLAADTVAGSVLGAELLKADGMASGLTVDGAVALSSDGTRVIFTPDRPLLPGRRFRARFTGGVADTGGTFYRGAPVEWTFSTSASVVSGGQVHPERFHVRVPENGVAEIYGDPGAVPGVPAGSTPWVVTPEIEGPVADPVRDTFQMKSDGSFSGTVGHPPDFPVTLGSRVWVKVFDPSGTLAAEFRVSPFVTADGKGFVAPAGEAVLFRSAEGIEVQVPAGAFDEAKLVRVSRLDPSSVGLDVPEGLRLGAYVSLDFEGEAEESLRLAVPAPADAPVGAQVFVGEEVSLPWGRRMKVLTVGAVEEWSDGLYLSNDPALQPDLEGASQEGSVVARSEDGATRSIGAKALPRRFLRSRIQEFRFRSDAVWFYEFGASWTMMSGSVQPFSLGLGIGLEAIYNKIADLWVYLPAPHDWNGGFVLPVLAEQPLEIVRRDTATGWILSETSYGPLPPDTSVVDVGIVPGGPPRHPLLADASPFRLVRFEPTAPGARSALTLEVEAEERSDGTVVVGSSEGFALPSGSHVALYDLTPALPPDADTEPAAPIAGPSTTVCGGEEPWSLQPMTLGDEMMVVVGSGDLDAETAGTFELQFDRPLVELSESPPGEVVTLLDLGPVDDCSVGGTGGYPADIPVTLEQTVNNSRLTIGASVGLAAGHRFRLELQPEALVAAGEGALSYWPSAPHRFDFATRAVVGDPVAGTPSGQPSLGDTDTARDLLRLGNLLMVASEHGEMVAFDVSDTTEDEGLRRHGRMNRASSYIRAMATDGHGRIFYTGLFGPLWAVKTVRLEDVREASAECLGAPSWAAGLPCFGGVKGSARVAYRTGFTSGFTASEWLAYGTLPSGTPSDLKVLTRDEKGKELALGEFVETYVPGESGFEDLTADAEGIYTFDVALSSTLIRSRAGALEPSLPPGSEPQPAVTEWRERVCDGEEDYDRYQRVTVDNLTTGQSWSIDVENPWPDGAGDGTEVLTGVRARRGDRMRVRYNLRAIGHMAIIGSGITVLDLNRFYRLTQPGQSPGGGQCGRRLGKYEGGEIDWPDCAPSSIDLYSGLAWTPAIESLSATGCTEAGGCRGVGSIDFYAPVMRLGALHARSVETEPGAIEPEAELAACIRDVAGTWSLLRDVAVATEVEWVDRGVRGMIDGTFQAPEEETVPEVVDGDLLALSLGRAGVFVFDIGERSILYGSRQGGSLIGHLKVPDHSVYRVQVDPARQLLFAGGTDEKSGEPVVDIWDLRSVNGAPDLPNRPVPRASLNAAWGPGDIGIDGTGTGLVYTWNQDEGAQVTPFERPSFTLTGLYRTEDEDRTGQIEPAERGTGRFVPLGVPVRAVEPTEQQGLDDEREATAAFRVRAALPGSLGPELTVRVQSLRVLPAERHLDAQSLGQAVTPPGGPGWPDNEVVVRLRRVGVGSDESADAGLAAGEAGPLGVGYQVYESVETVLLVADPRAGQDYRRQDALGTEADEEGQCRRCGWPAYLPDPTSDDPALDDVEELLAGRYVRVFLSPSDTAGTETERQTREALAWFRSQGDNYPAPSAWAEVAAPAAGIPSPLQVSLTEPAAHPAVWSAGEAGVEAALTGSELMLSAADHMVRGRSIPFAFERSYRSGTLGYGPLGSAGWWSPLFSQIRELPSGEVEYHDGQGRVWRFPPGTLDDVPEGYEEDESATSYLVPEGLYVRLTKLSGGQGWLLVSRNHGTARFDASGRLTELADRHHRGGTAGEQGSRLRLRYDLFGRLTYVLDDLGRSYRLEYYDDPRPAAEGGDGPRYGLLRSLTDFADRSIEYRWDADRRLEEVRLPEVENPVSAYGDFSYTGTSRPTVRYTYDPTRGAPSDDTATTALLHGDFAALRLAAFELPSFVDGVSGQPRARFEYDGQTGRLTTVAFPTPENVNTETSSVEWSLSQDGTSPTVGPAESVDVQAPWGHGIEHEITDGRLAARRERLQVHRPGEGPTEEAVETSFQYADDGRLTEVLRPDGGRVSWCYQDGEGGSGCPGAEAESSDRLAAPNVVARFTAATTAGAQGTADYTEVATEASYQEDNLVATVTDGESRTIDLPVPEASREDVMSFRAEGVGARSVYDAYGRPTRTEGQGDGPVTRMDYGEDAEGVSGAGLVSRIERGEGENMASWQAISYDDAFNVEEVRSSFGERKEMLHDAWDRPVRQRSGLTEGGPYAPVGASSCGAGQGAVVERAFDAAGHVVRERRLQDHVDAETGATVCRWVEMRYRWNLREQLVAVEQTHLANPEEPGAVLPGARRTASRSYDEHGRIAEERSHALAHPNVVTQYSYDDAGRMEGAKTGAEGEVRLGYDEMSRVVLRTDGDQGVWRGRFDVWDRLYHEELPTGAVRRTRFDRAHQPIEEQTFSGNPVADPEAELVRHVRTHVTSFGAAERVVEDLTAEGERRVTERAFDGSGRVTAVWSGPEGDPGRVDRDAARREMETVYEPASGRIVTRRYGGAFGASAAHEERFEYLTDTASPWPDRRILRESVPGQAEMEETFSTRMARDVFGRVLSRTRSDGEQATFVYDRGSRDLLRMRTGAGSEEAYSRDGRGLPVQVTRPNGRGFSLYSHDLDGVRLSERTATADGVSLWETVTTYDATGRAQAIDYADGTREERTYHPDSQVARVLTRDGVTLTFTYDAANRLKRVTPETAEPTTTLVDAGDAFAYDELSRPTRLERGRAGVSGLDSDLTVSYPSYDLASRPSAETVGTREPLSWTYDVFSNRTEVRLPAGAGRAAGGSFSGFSRRYDSLDRLTAGGGLGAGGLSTTPVGADWTWGGSARLYGMTTRGALGTSMRLGYHGGAGPQVPGVLPGSASDWKLGRLTWGAAGASGPAAAPEVAWGDFGFGWRGREGSPSDGAKIGREVFGDVAQSGVLAEQGWAWDYDAGVRLREAVSGSGSLLGTAAPSEEALDRFTYSYGTGDELLEMAREATGDVETFTAGDYGRPTARDGQAFSYDPAGRRLEDDRFVYRWDWRGQLVSVEIKDSWPSRSGGNVDGEPDASPYAGHRLRYDYDARGRLTRRLHEGAEAAGGGRPFIEERRFVWENDRLAAEAAYGPSETGDNLRWRRTYVPGPSGLDDPPQVVVEIAQPGSPYSGEARTYTYIRDELGTVLGLVAEDEGTDPTAPPVPIRYRYTPYGEAHAEIGPELERARYGGNTTTVVTPAGTVTQTVADETLAAAGALTVTWSVPLDRGTFADGLIVEELLPGSGWTPVAGGDLAIGRRATEGAGTVTDSTRLHILLTEGWQRGRSYRVRLTPALADRLGRNFARTETLDWAIPTATEGEPLPPVQYDQHFPIDYESYRAAATTAGGRFPSGQSRLFQGLWTDPVTGMAYARARWYDARNAAWLAEDPLLDIDSPNLYAFVGWQPTMATDPMGRYKRVFHQGLTQYLARLAGFTLAQATMIANSAQQPDQHGDPRNPLKAGTALFIFKLPGTASVPRSPSVTDRPKRNRAANLLKEYHFPLTSTPEGPRVVPGSDEASALYRKGIAQQSLTLFGEGLHPLQDSFPHRGEPSLMYFEPTSGTFVEYGHAEERGGYMSPATDEPENYPIVALDAAAATFEAMIEYRRVHDPDFTDEEFHELWEAFAAAPILEFINTDDSEGRREWLMAQGILLAKE